MENKSNGMIRWQKAQVTSPLLDLPVSVVVARDVPYISEGSRFQTLNLYLPETAATLLLVDNPVVALPNRPHDCILPCYQVHIHGGAWRDPAVTANSIEPTVAHAFSGRYGPCLMMAVISINYRLSYSPKQPGSQNVSDDHSGEVESHVVHPEHLRDVLQAFALLSSFGLTDRSYVLTGHSAGACLAFQAILKSGREYGLLDTTDAPCPAAMIGFNGLYDLPALVHDLDAPHEHLREDYCDLLTRAFSNEENIWADASPARFDSLKVEKRVKDGLSPPFVVLEESREDQLVPINQMLRLESTLARSKGLQVRSGSHITGKHAAPWEDGQMIWRSVLNVMDVLGQQIMPDAKA